MCLPWVPQQVHQHDRRFIDTPNVWLRFFGDQDGRDVLSSLWCCSQQTCYEQAARAWRERTAARSFHHAGHDRARCAPPAQGGRDYLQGDRPDSARRRRARHRDVPGGGIRVIGRKRSSRSLWPPSARSLEGRWTPELAPDILTTLADPETSAREVEPRQGEVVPPPTAAPTSPRRIPVTPPKAAFRAARAASGSSGGVGTAAGTAETRKPPIPRYQGPNAVVPMAPSVMMRLTPTSPAMAP
jgi:hypothetical protein